MGFVSLIMMVYAGISEASALTGMKPENRPGFSALMGTQGLSNVDSTME